MSWFVGLVSLSSGKSGGLCVRLGVAIYLLLPRAPAATHTHTHSQFPQHSIVDLS